MTYELAKKLKDAGFPIEMQMGRNAETNEFIELYVKKYPTLSELIEACDRLDGFGQLGRANKGWNVWRLGAPHPVAFGETPEEAVANLWLELNKK